MFLLAAPQDGVIAAILDETLRMHRELIRELLAMPYVGNLSREWTDRYPLMNQCLGPTQACDTLDALLAAHHDPLVYDLTAHHLLILYECLEQFCETHNELCTNVDLAQSPGAAQVGPYQIIYLGFQDIIERYFWDQSIQLTENPPGGDIHSTQDATRVPTVLRQILQGKPAGPLDLVLTPSLELPSEPQESLTLYEAGNPYYPSWLRPSRRTSTAPRALCS